MAGQGILDFYKTTTLRGFARQNLFRVEQITNNIYVPDDSSNLFLYIRDGSIPSRSVTTTNVPFKGFNYTVPLKSEYPEGKGSWSLTMYTDKEYVLKNLTEKWSVNTFDEHTSTATGPQWWNTDVIVNLLDNSSSDSSSGNFRIVRKYTLKGAFPTNIGSVSYKVEEGAAIATLTMNLAFQYIISESVT